MYDYDYGFEILFLCVLLIIFFPFLLKHQKLLLDLEEFEEYLINSGECVSTVRNVNRAGNSEYRGVFLYNDKYYEIDLDINDYISLGGVLDEE